MRDRTCGECANFPGEGRYCRYYNDVYPYLNHCSSLVGASNNACEKFEEHHCDDGVIAPEDMRGYYMDEQRQ